jgi:DNA-directed RNA polymerase specialized sigma subunit
MKFDSREFKELQKEWYGKLKETGFKDIENANNQDMPLADNKKMYRFDDTYWDNMDNTNDLSELTNPFQLYYDLSLLSTNDKDIDILNMLGDGMSIRAVAKILGMSKSSLYRYVQELVKQLRR